MSKRALTAVSLGVLLASPLEAAPATYETPQAALEAFANALVAPGADALIEVFSAEAEDILSTGDPVEDRQNRAELVALYSEGYRMIPEDDGGVVLALGAEGWPFPIPLTRSDAGWFFDIEAGRSEVISRRIGRNELDTITLMEAYVDVQSNFRLVDHDGDGVMEFAQSIISSEEDRDGLFWPGPESPVGALFARAALTGYSDGNSDHAPESHDGYYFQILTSQGDSAPGGSLDYIAAGNMVSGHALLAVPAAYGDTGVHSFMVSENGIVLEADLGDATLDLAKEIDRFDPGSDWTPVE